MIAFTDCFIVINELKHGKCLAWCYSFSSACKDEEDCQYYYYLAQSPSLSAQAFGDLIFSFHYYNCLEDF